MSKPRFKTEPNTYKSLLCYLSSGDDDYPGCIAVLAFYKWRFTLSLPQWVLHPYQEKVFAKSWDAATVARLGRDWYWHTDERQYGVSFHDDMVSVYYGRHTNDSSTEQRWGRSIPWLQQRHVRHSLYGLKGEHYWTCPRLPMGLDGDGWLLQEVRTERVPKVIFSFLDYDGEPITATTCIEEREWHRGEGWFRWLRWFYRPLIRRSLDLHFDKETGRKKGSWKGGTIGHSIEMLPGELHEAAFRRYCTEHHMKFIAQLPAFVRGEGADLLDRTSKAEGPV